MGVGVVRIGVGALGSWWGDTLLRGSVDGCTALTSKWYCVALCSCLRVCVCVGVGRCNCFCKKFNFRCLFF